MILAINITFISSVENLRIYDEMKHQLKDRKRMESILSMLCVEWSSKEIKILFDDVSILVRVSNMSDKEKVSMR